MNTLQIHKGPDTIFDCHIVTADLQADATLTSAWKDDINENEWEIKITPHMEFKSVRVEVSLRPAHIIGLMFVKFCNKSLKEECTRCTLEDGWGSLDNLDDWVKPSPTNVFTTVFRGFPTRDVPFKRIILHIYLRTFKEAGYSKELLFDLGKIRGKVYEMSSADLELNAPSQTAGEVKLVEIKDKSLPAGYYPNYWKHDFVIVANNEERFGAHKALLIARSPYFETLFHGDMKEVKENEIKLPYDAAVIDGMLEYMYLGKVSSVITADLAKDWLEVSHRFLSDGFKDIIQAVLIKLIDLNTVLQFLVLADRYNAKSLYLNAALFMKKNIKEILSSGAIEKLADDVNSSAMTMAMTMKVVCGALGDQDQ